VHLSIDDHALRRLRLRPLIGLHLKNALLTAVRGCRATSPL
jgi:hypothetical protein